MIYKKFSCNRKVRFQLVKMELKINKGQHPIKTKKIEGFLNTKYKMPKKSNLLCLCIIKPTHIFKNKNNKN